MRISAKINDFQVWTALNAVGMDASKAIVWAINRTLGPMATEINKEVRVHYSMRAETVKKHLKIYEASERYQHYEGSVQSSGQPIPISQFVGTRATKRSGVNVRVKKGGSKTRLKHAFTTRVIGWSKAGRSGGIVGSAHQGIFMRKRSEDAFTLASLRAGSVSASGGNKAYVGRTPIEEVFGPSVPTMIDNPQVLKRVERNAANRLQHQLASRIKYILDKRWAKRAA